MGHGCANTGATWGAGRLHDMTASSTTTAAYAKSSSSTCERRSAGGSAPAALAVWSKCSGMTSTRRKPSVLWRCSDSR
eukprot:604537-Prymnesium_polylepis.1